MRRIIFSNYTTNSKLICRGGGALHIFILDKKMYQNCISTFFGHMIYGFHTWTMGRTVFLYICTLSSVNATFVGGEMYWNQFWNFYICQAYDFHTWTSATYYSFLHLQFFYCNSLHLSGMQIFKCVQISCIGISSYTWTCDILELVLEFQRLYGT